MMSMLQLGSPPRTSEEFRLVPVHRHVCRDEPGLASMWRGKHFIASYYIHHVEDVITTFG